MSLAATSECVGLASARRPLPAWRSFPGGKQKKFVMRRSGFGLNVADPDAVFEARGFGTANGVMNRLALFEIWNSGMS